MSAANQDAFGLARCGFRCCPTRSIRHRRRWYWPRETLRPQELKRSIFSGVAADVSGHALSSLRVWTGALQRQGADKEAMAQMREETTISPESPMAWIEISRLELAWDC